MDTRRQVVLQFNTEISIIGLCLQRGEKRLIENLNLQLKAGDGLELRGANGSGKSTLLRAIAGLHRPAKGKISIGQNLDLAQRENLILLGHHDGVQNNETVRRQLEFWAVFFGTDKTLVDNAIENLGLSKLASLVGGVLSAGQRQRVALARLLIADRAIWLLDEPAAPLDEKGRELLQNLLKQHRGNGGIIFIAAHNKPQDSSYRMLKIGESASGRNWNLSQ